MREPACANNCPHRYQGRWIADCGLRIGDCGLRIPLRPSVPSSLRPFVPSSLRPFVPSSDLPPRLFGHPGAAPKHSREPVIGDPITTTPNFTAQKKIPDYTCLRRGISVLLITSTVIEQWTKQWDLNGEVCWPVSLGAAAFTSMREARHRDSKPAVARIGPHAASTACSPFARIWTLDSDFGLLRLGPRRNDDRSTLR